MRPDARPDRYLLRRTASVYHGQKRRAARAGHALGYALADLRLLVKAALAPPAACPYCGERLTAGNFSVDHAQPVSRGGAWGAGNLLVCCEACNRAKGRMAWAEFAALLGLMAPWPAEARADVLLRLKAGGRVRRGA